jgi:phosphoenolpyruvate-protein phosphotransferase (PTS system enzyme I)
MKTFRGKSVSNDVAIGKLFLYQKEVQQVKRSRITNEEAEKEVERYHQASDKALKQLENLYEKSVKAIGESNAAIFEVHQMMLQDDDFVEAIENSIRTQLVNAEYAVATIADNFYEMFSSMEDAYMRGRAADIKDISERVIGNFEENLDQGNSIKEPVIVIAKDLAPSETVQFDPSMVLGFVTAFGSVQSHTAILAKTMNIPALVGTKMEMDESLNGKMAIIDGKEGILYIEPTEILLAEFEQRLKEEQRKKRLLQELKGKENITLDGTKVEVFANIGNRKDLAYVLENDANGIGLFRSEFLYLEKDHYPTEEEQFTVYKAVAETMAGRKVIFRTLDIGADKQVDYFQLEKEENPAMGMRAIRICLTRPEVFKTQLRALFRASAFGHIAIMYPMIISLGEIKKIKSIVQEVKKELDEQGIVYQNVEEGIMIETPAAVMMSEEFAKEVDFFSIGTNDLTQYTLAIDRQNPTLEDFYDSHHPAILKMIQMVIENGHKQNIWVGICGELGGDLELTRTFLKMGVDELSVSPGKVLSLREIIRKTDLST